MPYWEVCRPEYHTTKQKPPLMVLTGCNPLMLACHCDGHLHVRALFELVLLIPCFDIMRPETRARPGGLSDRQQLALSLSALRSVPLPPCRYPGRLRSLRSFFFPNAYRDTCLSTLTEWSAWDAWTASSKASMQVFVPAGAGKITRRKPRPGWLIRHPDRAAAHPPVEPGAAAERGRHVASLTPASRRWPPATRPLAAIRTRTCRLHFSSASVMTLANRQWTNSKRGQCPYFTVLQQDHSYAHVGETVHDILFACVEQRVLTPR